MRLLRFGTLISSDFYFCRIRESVGKKVVWALKLQNEAVTHAAIDMLCALMHPMHKDFEIRYEQLNKTSLLMTKAFLESLLEMWINHVVINHFSKLFFQYFETIF